MRLALVLIVAALLTGSLSIRFPGSVGATTVAEVEARLAPLAPGSSAGANATNGSVHLTALSGDVPVLRVSNANATGTWHVRLALHSASNAAILSSLTVSLDNGALVGQVLATGGILTRTTGPLVALGPGQSIDIRVAYLLSAPGVATTLVLDLVAADDATEAATVTSRITVRLG